MLSFFDVVGGGVVVRAKGSEKYDLLPNFIVKRFRLGAKSVGDDVGASLTPLGRRRENRKQ